MESNYNDVKSQNWRKEKFNIPDRNEFIDQTVPIIVSKIIEIKQ